MSSQGLINSPIWSLFFLQGEDTGIAASIYWMCRLEGSGQIDTTFISRRGRDPQSAALV